MQIWIHDKDMRKVCALNNNIPGMLPYSNSQWHTYLEYSTSTLDFTIPKIVNGKLHEDIKYINDQMYVSFYYDNSYHVFYVSQLIENDFNFQVTCNNTNLELAAEISRPLASVDGAKTLEWYLQNLELLGFAGLEIGINEVSDKTRTITFESQSGTKLEQLHSLMNQFDAEFVFRTDLNRDGTLKKFVIDIYHRPDENHHGIGKVRGDVTLYYQTGLKGVQVSSDKTQLFNAGYFVGKDGLTLGSVVFEEKNELGQVEFYSFKDSPMVYAPLSADKYPSALGGANEIDRWTRRDFQTEYSDVDSLKAYALRTIKQYAYPLMTYTVSVQSSFIENYKDINLGDTIKIVNNNFRGGLALEARVSEMIISFDMPQNNSVVFTNFRKLDNKPSSELQQRIDEIVSKSLPYRVEIRTTNGTVFKNGIGRSTVKPVLKQGDKIVDATYRFVIDGTIKYSGMTYDMVASEITQPTTLTVAAWVDNKEVASEEVTFVNVSDGKQGPKGNDGTDAPTIFVKSYTYSAGSKAYIKLTGPNAFEQTLYYSRGHNVWVLDATTHKLKEFVHCDTYITMSFNHNGVNITLADYLNSITDSIVAIAAADADAVDQNFRDVLNKMGGNPELGTWSWRTGHVFIGMSKRSDGTWPLQPRQGYEVSIQEDGSAPEIGCTLSIGGIVANGADGKTQYTHIAYANSADGSKDFSTSDSNRAYIGMYVDFNINDSTNPSDYSWTLVKGSDGRDGIPGKPGADGKTPYFHTAWAYSADGTDGFTTVYPNLNLLEGTATFDGMNPNSSDNSVSAITKTKISGIANTVMDVKTSGNAFAVGFYTQKGYNITAGQTITISFIAKASSDTSLFVGFEHFPSGHKMFTISTKWELYTYTFTATTSGTPTFVMYGWDMVAGQGFQLYNPKAELGSVATPWMPSASEVKTADYPSFIGHYTNYTPVDSPNPRDYTWSLIRGNDGKQGPQGPPGQKGADGKTPYVHFAYADSADGQKGFSLTQTGSKRYLGVLTNFIKEDSTNPADYTWSDTAGSISVGGRNLLKGSKGPFKPDRKPTDFDNYVYYENETSVYLEQGKQYIISAKTDGNFTKWHNGGIESDNITLWLFRFWDVVDIVSDSNTGTTGTQFTWNHPTGTYHLRVNTYHKTAIKSVWEVKIEEGTIKTDWTPAIEDIQDEIDSKADAAMTIEQINALNERAAIIKAEMEAKASAEILNNWIKNYQDFVKANETERAAAEKALISSSQRVSIIAKELGELSDRWSFIDSYMTASNDGLVIGKNDGSSGIMINPNGRISMYSAGEEVMYISQGVIHIENGIFSKTIQVGRYREEQYHLNPDMNVIRYVGGF